jgi:hypothetical protein
VRFPRPIPGIGVAAAVSAVLLAGAALGMVVATAATRPADRTGPAAVRGRASVPVQPGVVYFSAREAR